MYLYFYLYWCYSVLYLYFLGENVFHTRSGAQDSLSSGILPGLPDKSNNDNSLGIRLSRSSNPLLPPLVSESLGIAFPVIMGY